MTTFFRQLKREADAIRLSKDERVAMRRRIEEEIRTKPIRLQDRHKAVPSPYFPFIRPRQLVPVLILMLVVVGGGTTYAAQGALPGDLLYPVKIGVNEPIRTALAFSAQSKAAVHAEFAQQRLEEAATLAARGALTPEAKTELQTNFEAQANALQKVVEDVGRSNPIAAADISAHFSADVAAQARVVAALGGESDNQETRRESGTLASNIEKHGEKVAHADRTNVETQGRSGASSVGVQATAQTTSAPQAASGTPDTDAAVAANLAANVRDTLDTDQAKLDAIGDSLDATTTAEVQTKISTIRTFVDNVNSHGGDSKTMRRDIEEALRDSAALQAFLEARAKFETKIVPPALNIEDKSTEHTSDNHEQESHDVLHADLQN